MPEIPVLGELLAVLAAALVVAFICHRLRVPTLIGFLLAGVLIGPGGAGLVHDRHAIEVVAEIGVVLLLFTIGVEFSLKELLRIKGLVIRAGGGQILLTIGLVALIGLGLGLPWNRAVFVGFLLALSSTAIVLTLLIERGEMNALHGRVTLAVLLAQDLAIVPLMLLTPLLGGGDTSLWEVARLLGVAALVVVATLWGASRLFPRALELVARTGRREMFTIFTILAALGTAYLTGRAGLSLALGAFLAGLVISESEYGTQVLSEVTPLKDVFNSLFFVSVGMLVEPSQWIARPELILGAVAGVLLLKGLVSGAVVLSMGLGFRVAVISALSLAQVGEFSFVLAHIGLGVGLLEMDVYQVFLSVSVATMALTPAGMALAAPLATRVGRVPWLHRYLSARRATSELHREAEAIAEQASHGDHVLICGFGLNGQNVARVLRGLSVPYLILELNPGRVADGQQAGEPILYGDASYRQVLEHADAGSARAVVVTVRDPATTRRIVATARALNTHARLFVRTLNVQDVEDLIALGADEVVPEEFETSLELVGRVMAAYGCTESAILREKMIVRRNAYRLLRQPDEKAASLGTIDDLLSSADIVLAVVAQGAEAAGLSLEALSLPRRFGVSVVGVDRGGDTRVGPGADFVLRPGDRAYLFGTPASIREAWPCFEASGPQPSAGPGSRDG